MRKANVRTALVALVISALLAGCTGSASLSSATSVNTQTGAVTETVTAGATINFGGAAKPQISLGGSPGTTNDTGYHIANSVPVAITLNSGGTVQAVLTALTDTDYTSTFTATLLPTTTTVSPANPGDVVYAWYLPDTSDLDTWEQQISNNTNSQVQVSSSIVTYYNASGASQGSYSITATLQVPDGSSAVAASSGVYVGNFPGKQPPGCIPGRYCTN
jgi:hypothetical protein